MMKTSMFAVQLKLIKAEKSKFFKLFIGNSLTWLLVFLGAINTLREFVVNERLNKGVTYLCETFSELGNMGLLWLFFLVVAIVVFWPKVKASFTLPNNIKIIVECCDLMKQKGLKVIQTTETFDTVLGGVIKPNSVHGTFLKYCEDKKIDIDKYIAMQLGEKQDVKYKHSKMPIGSICPISIDGDLFCLIAFTHWDSCGKNINLTETEYKKFLGTMWDKLGLSCVKSDVVNVAVLGNANLKQTKMYTTEQRISDMIKTFIETNSECCRTLRICVHSNNASEIDFANFSSIIRFLYNSMELKRVLEYQ